MESMLAQFKGLFKEQTEINANQIETSKNLIKTCKQFKASIDILDKRITFLEQCGIPAQK